MFKQPEGMIKPRFWIGRRDTRWDVYPQQEPQQIVAHDCHGYWEYSTNGFWFRTPRAFNFEREISRAEAEATTGPAPVIR